MEVGRTVSSSNMERVSSTLVQAPCNTPSQRSARPVPLENTHQYETKSWLIQGAHLTLCQNWKQSERYQFLEATRILPYHIDRPSQIREILVLHHHRSHGDRYTD